MTCKEKLIKEHPEWSAEEIEAEMSDFCPHDCGYLGRPHYCYYNNMTEDNCRACWDREIYNDEDETEADEVMEQVVEDLKAGTIKDSGDRTEFSTGAVRDMREGKGRCDLMPLEVVAYMLSEIYNPQQNNKCLITNNIDLFMKTNHTEYLYTALMHFREMAFNGSNENMLLEVAKHFEEGAKKYGTNNWQKGIPPYCYIDSAIRHYLKWSRGDNDERHDRAFVWNLMCCIWEVDYHKEAN